VAALAAAPAGAHVVVLPGEGRPADPQIYRVVVPTERDAPTVDVRLRMPAGIDFALVESPPEGWTARVVRQGDRITELRWSGGEIPPDGFAEFRFLARNPVQAGEIAWPVVQRYRNGDVQRWIGAPGSESPASRTRIAEDARSQDVVSVNGESRAPATSDGAAPAGSPGAGPAVGAAAGHGAAGAGEGGRDALTLALALCGALLGAGALALALTRRPAASGRTA